MKKKHPYHRRLWWRQRLPWFLINLGLAKKGVDCAVVEAEHHWYKMDDKLSGCYYCEKTTDEIKWE